MIAYGELLELVLARNPFQRARLAGWDRETELPPLTKQELVADQAAHPPFGTNLTYELDRYVAMHQTSGTTGPPLRVLDTAEDWAWWRACLARSYERIGIGADDRVALAFSFGPHVHFWATKEGLQEVGAMAIVTGGMTSAQRLQTIAETGATALACTPTYALRLHEVAVEQRMEAALDSIEAVVCTGEPGGSLPAVRAAIEEAFGARVFEHAGSTEAGPFGYPCTEGGLHIDESQFACEIVAPAGERGELLITPLGRTGFPVLRYRTGDVVAAHRRALPGRPRRPLAAGRDRRPHRRHGRDPRDERVPVGDRGGGAVGHRLGRVPHHLLHRDRRHGRGQARGRARRRLVRRPAAGRDAPPARPAGPDRAGVARRAAAQREQVAPRGRPAGAGLVVRIKGASEQVAAALQHRIQEAGLGPGDFLGREEDLAAEFGVSRPTLREALKLLASGNLIRANKGPGGGIFVAHTADQGVRRSLSDSVDMMVETGAVSLEELLDARILLEVPVAGLAALQAGEETVDRLRAALAAETEAGADMDAIHAADTEFHREIGAAAGNRIAQALTGWVIEVLQPRLMAELRDAVVPQAVLDQHTALLKAIEKGDRPRAERAMREHLLYLRDVLAMTRER